MNTYISRVQYRWEQRLWHSGKYDGMKIKITRQNDAMLLMLIYARHLVGYQLWYHTRGARMVTKSAQNWFNTKRKVLDDEKVHIFIIFSSTDVYPASKLDVHVPLKCVSNWCKCLKTNKNKRPVGLYSPLIVGIVTDCVWSPSRVNTYHHYLIRKNPINWFGQ